MKFAVDLSKGVLGAADSPKMWATITAYIPDSLLVTPGIKILSVACGHCTEAVNIAKRMIALGVNKDTVRESIWLVDKYKVFTNHAKIAYGFTNVITADFLEWETDMEFDVVLGNPPYLNGTWREFITKACLLSKQYVIMIAPDGANSYSSRGKQIQTEMINSGIQSVTDVTSYFPTVTSGKIVCYAFNNQQLGQASAFAQTSIADSILQKVTSLSANKLECQIGNQSKSFIDLPRYERKQAGLITIVESLSVDKPPVFSFIESSKAKEFSANGYWFVTRFFGQAENSPVIDCKRKSAISHRIIAIKKINNETAEAFQKVYCSKLMRCVINTGKNGKFDTPMFILKQLPQLSMSKKWTDKALYKHFKLTQEEIAYVEANVK